MKDSQAHVNMKMIINMSIIKFQIMTLLNPVICESLHIIHIR
jgi:hypothetical protein